MEVDLAQKAPCVRAIHVLQMRQQEQMLEQVCWSLWGPLSERKRLELLVSRRTRLTVLSARDLISASEEHCFCGVKVAGSGMQRQEQVQILEQAQRSGINCSS